MTYVILKSIWRAIQQLDSNLTLTFTSNKYNMFQSNIELKTKRKWPKYNLTYNIQGKLFLIVASDL